MGSEVTLGLGPPFVVFLVPPIVFLVSLYGPPGVDPGGTLTHKNSYPVLLSVQSLLHHSCSLTFQLDF